MEPSHVDFDLVIHGVRLPVIFTVVRALGGRVTQGAGLVVTAEVWRTRSSQSFRGILVVRRVRVCMFEWFKGGRGRLMQVDGACVEGWRVLKRQSRSQPRRRPTRRRPHACHSMHHTRIPCSACPTLPSVPSNLPPHKPVRPTSTLFIPPTRRVLCCCRSSSCPQR
jgi:hypothetical protein